MLAIVIPYFKSTFFEGTLDSLANQTNQRFKVYIGDDASKEAPIFLLEKYKDKIDISYHRFEENLGGISLTKQWERCIEMMNNEEWLMLLCDDDIISSNFVEAFYLNIEEINYSNVNVVHFAVRRYYEGSHLSDLYEHPKIELATDAFFRKYFGSSHGSLSEQIFRKEAYMKHKFREIPLAWGSDDLAWLYFSDFGKIFGINSAEVHFRISNENISREGFKESLKKASKLELFKILIENDLYQFPSHQRIQLILHYERLVYRFNQVSLRFWWKQCFLLLRERKIELVFRSVRKYFKYIINRLFKSKEQLVLTK